MTEERLLSGYSGRMFLVLTLGLASVKLTRYLLPPLLPEIIRTLQITPFKAGVALSLMTFFFAVLQYPSGRLADRLSRKTILVAGLALVLCGLVFLSGTRTYAVFLVAMVVIGSGEGLYTLTDRVLLSDIFERRRGEAFGYHIAAFDVSGLAAAGLATLVLAVAIWRSAFLLVLVVLSLVIVLLHRWSRESYDVGWVPLDAGRTLRRLVGDPHMRLVLVIYALVVFTQQGIVAFLPTFLQVDHGFSSTLANQAFAVLFVSGLLSKPIAGRLSDRIARPLIAVGALLVGTVGLGLLVVSSTLAFVVASVFLFAFGQKAFSPVIQAYLLDIFPDASVGGDFGATRMIYLGFASLGPIYVGYVASTVSFTAAFASLVVFFLTAAGLLGLLIVRS